MVNNIMDIKYFLFNLSLDLRGLQVSKKLVVGGLTLQEITRSH